MKFLLLSKFQQCGWHTCLVFSSSSYISLLHNCFTQAVYIACLTRWWIWTLVVLCSDILSMKFLLLSKCQQCGWHNCLVFSSSHYISLLHNCSTQAVYIASLTRWWIWTLEVMWWLGCKSLDSRQISVNLGLHCTWKVGCRKMYTCDHTFSIWVTCFLLGNEVVKKVDSM